MGAGTQTGAPRGARNRRVSAGEGFPKAPGILAGIGLGGFFDGIVFHQILQWHHFVSSTERGSPDTKAALEHNTMWDGIFHAVTWWVVAAAIYVGWTAWRQGRLAPPWRMHLGLMLVGWGGFSFFDGLVNHAILGIHNLREDVADPVPWELGYLVVSALLVGIGVAMARSGMRMTRDHRGDTGLDNARSA